MAGIRTDPVGIGAVVQRLGRVEAALNRDLLEHREIGSSERAALRAQARAVDVAESRRDVDAVTRANAVYLQLRTAAGLGGDGARPVDAFEALMAELTRPGAGASDLPND
jgi:hypothetical protein